MGLDNACMKLSRRHHPAGCQWSRWHYHHYIISLECEVDSGLLCPHPVLGSIAVVESKWKMTVTNRTVFAWLL